MGDSTLKFVIVGHVDHGKSTLIGRILYDTFSLSSDVIEKIKKVSLERGKEIEFAYLVDHLEEERQQNITIDTTQTFFRTAEREYVIIDAPGHVEFVKNMITGAAQAEAAILIIDAIQGVQEQTKRHASIISLLGIEKVIVVINKMDLANFSKQVFLNIKKEIEDFLISLNVKPINYIPISAFLGDNVVERSKNFYWYEGMSVIESLDSIKNEFLSENQSLIFPVQDIYESTNSRIIVGRVESGRIRSGQEVMILPRGELARIRSIEKFNEKVEESYSGESIGITTVDSILCERGNVFCEPGREPAVTDNFKAFIFWLSEKPLEKNDKIILKIATQSVKCTIEDIIERIDSATLKIVENNAGQLRNLEIGEVVIKAENNIVLEKFNKMQKIGRFVLLRYEDVCAGGIVNDPI